MSDVIARIIAMLGDEDAETRCAAAMVLARLRPLDDRAVAALRRGMKKAPLHARSYFLDALAATRDPRVVPDVIDVLDTKGSVVDMAIGVARGFGARALDEIARRHEGVAGWLNGAYIKAVAGIHQVKAARMLIDRLPAADWEQARATSMFFNEHFQSFPAGGQAYVRKALHRLVADPELPVPALITCLNLVRVLKEPVDRERLLVIAEGADSPSLRRHALAALEALPPDADRLADHRGRILVLLDAAEEDLQARNVVDLLAAWDEPPMTRAELVDLARRPGRIARDYAFQELARLHPKAAAPLLEAELRAEEPERRDAAIRALTALPEGLERLLAVFVAEEPGALRRRLGEALLEGETEIDETTARKLRRRFVASVADEQRFDAPLLELLGARDREGLNAHLVRQARKEIAGGEPRRAVTLLQPLVRHRHGSDEARFVLALANMKASSDPRRLDEPRTKRCIDILSPLARHGVLDLARKIAKAPELGAVEKLMILVGLAEKGKSERDLVRKLIDGLDASAFEERDHRALARLREDLESRP